MNGHLRLLSSLDAMVSASYYMLLHLLESYSSQKGSSSSSLTFQCLKLQNIYDISVTLMHPHQQSSGHYIVVDSQGRWYYSSRQIIKEFTAKLSQVTWPAIEQDERDRAEYKMLIGAHFQPEHLVFADESHFNHLSLHRNYAWAP